MLTSVHFENYKSLRDVRIDLEPFTVLVGGNGCGKSSALQALNHVTGLFGKFEYPRHMLGRPKLVFSLAAAPERLATAGASHFGLTIRDAGPVGEFSLHWDRPAQPYGGQLGVPPIFSVRGGGADLVYPLAPTEMGAEPEFFGRFPEQRPATLLQLDAAILAEPQYSDSSDPHVSFDGFGLGPTLQKLQLLRDGRFEAIEQALAGVVPFVRRLRVVPARVLRQERQRVSVEGQDFDTTVQRERTGARVEAEVRGSGWIAADLLSEGTLLTLALLTVLHDERPSLLLLDDLDRALHPLAQVRLVKALRALQATTSGLQIVTTTHSPHSVDCFAVEEVRVLRLAEDGGSVCLPLAEHPRWEKRKGFLLPGEFWSGVGEEWVGQ